MISWRITRRASKAVFSRSPARPAIYPLSLHDALPIYEDRLLIDHPPGADVLVADLRISHRPLGQPEGTMGNSEVGRSEEHTSELQSRREIVCRLLLEKKNLSPGKDARLHITRAWQRGE